MSEVYNKVEEGQVIDMHGSVFHEEATINELLDHSKSLIERYENIPMNLFSGAPVE